MNLLRKLTIVMTIVALLGGFLMVMTPAMASEADQQAYLPLVVGNNMQVVTPTPTPPPCFVTQETGLTLGRHQLSGWAIVEVWSNKAGVPWGQAVRVARINRGETWYLQDVGGKIWKYSASCTSNQIQTVLNRKVAAGFKTVTWQNLRDAGLTYDPNATPTPTPPPCFVTQETGLTLGRHQLSGWAVVELWSNKAGVPWGQEVRVVRINLNETWYLQDVGGKIWKYSASCTSNQIQTVINSKVAAGFKTATWEELRGAGLTYDPNAPTPTPVPACKLKTQIQLKDVGIYDLGGWAVVELWTPKSVPWGANTVVKAMINLNETWHLKDVAGYGWFYENSCTSDQVKAELDRNPRTRVVTWSELNAAGLVRQP